MPPHESAATPTSPSRVAVAFSAGRDSTALLHATACAANAIGLRVVALHVHHGLNPRADDWLVHGEAQVRGWAAQGLPVSFLSERLTGQPGPGDSIEAWARTGRHEALQRMARQAGADLLLLAHHRRDQAETFLLQALRGAGSAGLAAMPRQQWRDGVCWSRPWLDHPREAIEAYVRAHELHHIDDDSNSDTRFARNRLRHALWPELLAAAPSAEASLAQSAAWAQEALALQQEIGAGDLADWADGEGGALAAAAWSALSPARLSNLVRAWLLRETGHAAPATLTERLLREVPGASVAQWPLGPTQVLRLYRGQLGVASLPSPTAFALDLIAPPPLVMDLSRPGVHPVPAWRGAIEVMAVVSEGVSTSGLNKVELRPREGGAQFQAHAHGIPRSLKKCWQTAGIPAPQREGPLLFADGALLYVPGLGIDARRWEAGPEGLLALRWHPDAC